MAEDRTDRKRLEQMLTETEMPAKNRGKQLQAFRESLGMTQPEFGARFGGYNQRQMSNYETGRAEVPLELILHIRAAGYPFEAVLGAANATVIEETVAYLAASRRERVLSRQLATTLTRLLDRDVATIERVLRAFDRPLPSLVGEQRLLDEHLTRLTAAPAAEREKAGR
jgi:transcriptional regulator with XRE-family HTH domain